MIQNLKIDIIYYNTPSDFEFEFNLGGCCHSRVLNSKSNTPKDMIASLSKAVGRSRIIILIGKLNESDGLFSLISKAIGSELEHVNAAEYNIIEGGDTTVISGSLPLVSSDGLLAGCIIESGPQSIIIMSEEKPIRKDICENLVFKYITAVSRTPETETVITPDSEPEETIAVTAEPTVEVAHVADVEAFPSEATVPAEAITESIEKEAIEDIAKTVTEVVRSAPDNIDAVYNSADSDTHTEVITNTKEEFFDKIPDINEINCEQNDDSFVLSTDDTPMENYFSEETEVGMDFISNDDFIDIYAEEKADIEMDSNFVYNEPKKHTEEDNYESKERPKNKTGGSNTFIWIILSLMFIVAAILTYMLVLTPIQKDISVIEYIKQVFNL